MAHRGNHRASGAGQTVNAGTADLATISITDGRSYKIYAEAVGRDAAGLSVSGERHALVKRVAGTVSVEALGTAIANLLSNSALATAGITVVIDNTAKTATLRVTGVNTKTIDWWGEMFVKEFEP